MYININDPRDPWAWRNKWNGESRYGNDDLWIWITLCILLIILAIIAILPLLMLKYCRGSCPCDSFFNWFEKFLITLHNLGKKNKSGFKRFQGNVRTSRRILRNSRKSPRNVNIYYVGRNEPILSGRKYKMSEKRTSIPKINLSNIS
ncbi:Hypothetical protein SRAE_2000494800 [Strongyloides ratti]|uniref:Uncharacterized protein n=1 Tax=Strongyloides ratti TaxID=34506 RepID=A0A090N099_STRRB|nr:Hypothetical protein SRAE_2000494800 [Strongyloides ratti]CEF70315.1 Hypothetical protein SRAE_2000494800 [Strongyloides ratti]